MEKQMNRLRDSFLLEGRKALIVCPERTGGQEIARGMAKAGAEIWLAGTDRELLEQQLEGLAGEGFRTGEALAYQPGSEEEADRLRDWAVSRMQRVDILVENSMDTVAPGWLQEPEEIWSQLARVQLEMMMTVQRIGTLMAAQSSGAVLLVADYGALAGYDPGNYLECPEKAAQDFSLTRGFLQGGCVNYARQAAGFLGEHGCRCNCLVCGPLEGTVPEAFAHAYMRHAHLKRLAEPEDIAAAAVFLCSDAARYITGAILPVDGGYCAK